MHQTRAIFNLKFYQMFQWPLPAVPRGSTAWSLGDVLVQCVVWGDVLVQRVV